MKRFSNACVKIVNRWLPDAYIFAIILTIVVFLVAIPVSGLNPILMANAWGNGIWSLLSFSMQMALVLVLGNAFATAPAIKKMIIKIALIPNKATTAVLMVSAVSMVCMWLNWGFGLVVGALLAREVALQADKKGYKVDYRLLIASAYSAMAIWHAGVSGSIPLDLASFAASIESTTGGAVTAAIPTSQTIFAPWNLLTVFLVAVGITVCNVLMHPKNEDEIVTVDASKFKTEVVEVKKAETPAEKLENSVILNALICLIMIVYLVYYFVSTGSFNLSLNLVNAIFLLLGMVFHKTPIGYVKAITDAAKGAAGIILQFPFYAGIMGMMTAPGPDGQSLAGAISNVFVAIATPTTFPMLTYLAAGFVNFFVPSGGGQWAVQGPIMMPAGAQLGVDPAHTAMGIAWGDAWTNLLQPFWALPALGIAGLGARDIMGYCVTALLVSGVISCIGLLCFIPLFG